MGTVTYVLFHLALYGAWRLVANREKVTRQDGKHIPLYATGGLGNAVGFTLVAAAIGMVEPIPSVNNLLIALILSLIVTTLLHLYWRKAAKGHTVSLYLMSGKATLAGNLHLLYVMFVSSLVVFAALLWHQHTPESVILTVSGLLLYAATVIFDRWRRVI